MVHRDRKKVGATVAKVGLLRTEIVIRGGFLSKPEVLGNVITVEGKSFVPLWRSCPVLNKFLTPQSSCLRPLKDTSIFETLREKREAVRLTLAETGPADEAEAEVDPADAFDLDAPVAAERPLWQRNAPNQKGIGVRHGLQSCGQRCLPSSTSHLRLTAVATRHGAHAYCWETLPNR